MVSKKTTTSELENLKISQMEFPGNYTNGIIKYNMPTSCGQESMLSYANCVNLS